LKTKLLGERDVQNVVSSDERVAVCVLKLTVDVFLFYRDKEKKNVALASVVWRDSLKLVAFTRKDDNQYVPLCVPLQCSCIRLSTLKFLFYKKKKKKKMCQCHEQHRD